MRPGLPEVAQWQTLLANTKDTQQRRVTQVRVLSSGRGIKEKYLRKFGEFVGVTSQFTKQHMVIGN